MRFYPLCPHSGSRAIHGLLANLLTVNVPVFAPGGPVRSASVRTEVKDVVTLLVKSRRTIPNAMDVSVTKGMDAISLLFTRSR